MEKCHLETDMFSFSLSMRCYYLGIPLARTSLRTEPLGTMQSWTIKLQNHELRQTSLTYEAFCLRNFIIVMQSWLVQGHLKKFVGKFKRKNYFGINKSCHVIFYNTYLYILKISLIGMNFIVFVPKQTFTYIFLQNFRITSFTGTLGLVGMWNVQY